MAPVVAVATQLLQAGGAADVDVEVAAQSLLHLLYTVCGAMEHTGAGLDA
jgi:hypothetical protein